MTRSTPNFIGFWAVQGRVRFDDEDTIGCPPEAMTRADARQWFIDWMRKEAGGRDAKVIIVGEVFSQSRIDDSVPLDMNAPICMIYSFLASLHEGDPRIDTLNDFIVNHLGDD